MCIRDRAIEDERFYKHSGIDIYRTAGAIFTYIANGGKSSFGGSTITQQLVKNLKEDDDDSIARKIREDVYKRQVQRCCVAFCLTTQRIG